MRGNSANCSSITVCDCTLLMTPLQVCIRVQLPFYKALSCASPWCFRVQFSCWFVATFSLMLAQGTAFSFLSWKLGHILLMLFLSQKVLVLRFYLLINRFLQPFYKRLQKLLLDFKRAEDCISQKAAIPIQVLLQIQNICNNNVESSGAEFIWLTQRHRALIVNSGILQSNNNHKFQSAFSHRNLSLWTWQADLSCIMHGAFILNYYTPAASHPMLDRGLNKRLQSAERLLGHTS